MLKGKRVQFFSAALVVAIAFTGCRARQQSPKMYQPAGGIHVAPGLNNRMLIPTPDSLPGMTQNEHAQAADPIPDQSTSSKSRRGIPNLRNQQSQIRTPQAPVDQPIRPVSSVEVTAPRPGMTREFGSKNFKSVSQMNFGGAWGQVAEPVPVQQNRYGTANTPLEIPNIDESFDLWPQAPGNPEQAEGTVTALPAPPAPETMSVAEAVTANDYFEDSIPYERSTTDQSIGALPLIVPSPRD
jgi:hypothetical protein